MAYDIKSKKRKESSYETKHKFKEEYHNQWADGYGKEIDIMPKKNSTGKYYQVTMTRLGRNRSIILNEEYENFKTEKEARKFVSDIIK